MKRLDIDTELVIDMYVNQGMSLRKISKIFDVDPTVITKRLKEKNITIKSSSQANREVTEKQVDIEKIVDMYVNQKMPSTKIGEIIGVAKTTILNKLKILGIPRRSKSEVMMLRNTQKKKDYSSKNMSTRNIVGRGSSCVEHQHFSGGPNLGSQTPIRKRLGGNSPNPTTI
tara:strand:+ start:319 stop:831 length:513 start_codon:yes stop_codon:yes gene_type:complete